VATLPPRAADAAGSAPVFERKARTALGLLHIRRYRCDAAPTSFGWHCNVALSDLTAADAEPRFRIFGSGAAELMGGDLTGKRLTEGILAAARDGVLTQFAAIRDERLIGLLMANVPIPGLEHRTFKVVELPLANDSGAVGQILHAFLTPPGVG